MSTDKPHVNTKFEGIKTLSSQMSTPEFRDFLSDLAKKEPGLENRRYNLSTNSLLNIHSEVLAIEVYLAIADMFDAYPTLLSILPVWKPTIDEDNTFIVLFKLEIKSCEGSPDNLSITDETYKYGECPKSFTDPKYFNHLIAAGEMIVPEHWNNIANSVLSNPKQYGIKDPWFHSKADVFKRLNKDCSGVLQEIQRWALEKEVVKSEANPSIQSSFRPSM